MDTPERNQICNSVSRFEDSPVFNYISTLSPLKPVKSQHVSTFNSLSFTSVPSIFSSPHVSSNKPSTSPRRPQNSDPPKHDTSSATLSKDSASRAVSTDATQMHDNSAELQENFEVDGCIEESPVETPSKYFKFPIELPQGLKHDCGSPDCGAVPCSSETKSDSAMAAALTSPVRTEKGSIEDQIYLHDICQFEKKKEDTSCHWGNLLSDASDQLIFNSPQDTEAFKDLIPKSLNGETRFDNSNMSQFLQDDMKYVPTMIVVSNKPSCAQHLTTDGPSSQPREAIGLDELDQTEDVTCTNPNEINISNEKMDKEPVVNLHCGILRRCLDFEKVGACRKNSRDISVYSSTISTQFDEVIASTNNQLVPIKNGRESTRHILPGIGLHLNALATTSMDCKSLKHESSSSGQQLVSSSPSYFDSPPDGQEPFHKSLASASSERDMDPTEIQLAEDASHSSAYLVSEEFNQNSPKKRRRRFELDGESEGCKRCNCKKSKCLKLYCECFAAGIYCIEPCSCQGCFNKPIHEETVLATRKQIESRNPLAFAPRVIRSSDSVTEMGDESSKTPASARHKRGCNCKKSSCLKKYCECYQGGVGCSINCRCEGCKNAFGRKDGSALVGTEAEPEEEPEAFEMNAEERAMQKTAVQNVEEHNLASSLPITPLQSSRLAIHMPFQSRSKPPRSSFPNIPALGLHSNRTPLGRPNILTPQNKSQRHCQVVSEEERPEMLVGDSSTTSIKTVSPNSKRVSQCNIGSPSRSGRKLILQSIPSFPSLTPHH